MPIETKALTLPCNSCVTELEESAMFEFSGGVACEKCVREYYEKSYREFPAKERRESIEVELQTRRRNAVLWLKRNRRELEKQAAKRERWTPSI